MMNMKLRELYRVVIRNIKTLVFIEEKDILILSLQQDNEFLKRMCDRLITEKRRLKEIIEDAQRSTEVEAIAEILSKVDDV